MRITGAIIALAKAESGKGVIKFSLGTCLLAIAVATASPAFQANPLFAGKLLEMRKHLPETLDRITEAMGG